MSNPINLGLEDTLRDNEIVEGEHVRKLKEFYQKQEWGQFEEYVQNLERSGFVKERIDSMITRATHGK